MKLDDGSHLNVMDDSDLTDFIHHHALRSGRGCSPTRRSSVLVGRSHRPDAKETPSGTIPDEMPLDDENGCDSETSVQKPLTASQKKVVQNIHNNYGHPSQSCPARGSRLRATRVRVPSMRSSGASSETKASSSVSADLSPQRNAWCGSF